MEGCPSYQPWHDKVSGKTFLVRDNWEVRFCDNYDGRW
jgi:hypothetical protein